MSLSLYIPIWLLWVLGVSIGLIVLALAVLGVCALFWLREVNRSWNRAWGWW